MQRETVTSLRARNPRSVSQSCLHGDRGIATNTTADMHGEGVAESASSKPSGWRGAAENTASGVLPIRPACGERW